MSNSIKQFDYRIIKMEKGDKLPFNPHVEIVLQQWTSNNDDGTPTISPNLMTEDEVDWHIRQCKADLDVVGKKAKLALLRAKNETMSFVSR